MAARDLAMPEVRIGRLAWISSTNRSLGFWNGVSDSGRPTPPACSLRQDSAQRHSALPPSAGSYPCARQWSCDGSLAGRSLRTSVASIAHSIREGSRRLADAAVSPRLLRPLRSYAGSRRAFQTCTLTRSQPTRMPASWRSRANSSKPGPLPSCEIRNQLGRFPGVESAPTPRRSRYLRGALPPTDGGLALARRGDFRAQRATRSTFLNCHPM
jgi:hypothetical protein